MSSCGWCLLIIHHPLRVKARITGALDRQSEEQNDDEEEENVIDEESDEEEENVIDEESDEEEESEESDTEVG